LKNKKKFLGNQFLMKKDLGLKYFILKRKSLEMYRKYLKMIKRIPDKELSKEIKIQVYIQFQKNINNHDIIQTRYNLKEAEEQLEKLETLIGISN
jgi:hypothetical protein